MIAATLGIFVLFAILVLIARPGAALGLIVMSMLVWPEYLRVPFGVAQMSVPRLVSLILLLRLLAMSRHRKLTGSAVDWLVVFVWAYTAFAMLISGAPTLTLITAFGSIFDSLVIYFTARLALTSLDDIRAFALPVGLTAIIMGVVGGIESIFHYSPYVGGIFPNKEIILRYGFKRAHASTQVSIYFGMAMVMVTAFLWSMRKFAGRWIWLALLAAVIGTLSTMSSGPWIGLFTCIVINLFFFKPNLIKPALYAIILLVIFVEVASNRHFYHLIQYLAIDSTNAWYRARLLEVAFRHLGEFWIIGIGDLSVNDWAVELDGRGHTDVVNHYIVLAIKGGLPALFAYIATHVVAIRVGIRSWREADSVAERTLIFGLCSALITLDISAMSVGFFGPIMLLMYMLTGIIVSLASMREKETRLAKKVARTSRFSGTLGIKSRQGVRRHGL